MLYLKQTFDILSDSSKDSLSVSLGPGLADVDEDEGGERGEYAAIFHTIIEGVSAKRGFWSKLTFNLKSVDLFTGYSHTQFRRSC